MAKRINTLLRHGELPREEDGAIEFWRMIFKTYLSTLTIGLMMYGRARWQEAEVKRKDFNIVLIRQDKKFSYLRALQGHSGRNPIDPSLQDNVLSPNNFFEYICHIGCAVNLHSITNSGLIPGGQNSSKDRQTVLFTAVSPVHKNHQDPIELDLTKPRLASYKQKWESAPQSGTNLRKKTILTNSLQKKREDTKDNGISLKTKQAKMCL